MLCVLGLASSRAVLPVMRLTQRLFHPFSLFWIVSVRSQPSEPQTTLDRTLLS